MKSTIAISLDGIEPKRKKRQSRGLGSFPSTHRRTAAALLEDAEHQLERGHREWPSQHACTHAMSVLHEVGIIKGHVLEGEGWRQTGSSLQTRVNRAKAEATNLVRKKCGCGGGR